MADCLVHGPQKTPNVGQRACGMLLRMAEEDQQGEASGALSARNRFAGVVRSVEVDGVVGLVEIESGPHRITAVITREAIEELGLEPGVEATALVKATSVMVVRER